MIVEFFVPETEETHFHFEAPSPDAVKQVNKRANIPSSKIHEVQKLVLDAV
jgi:hypothetical protein